MALLHAPIPSWIAEFKHDTYEKVSKKFSLVPKSAAEKTAETAKSASAVVAEQLSTASAAAKVAEVAVKTAAEEYERIKTLLTNAPDIGGDASKAVALQAADALDRAIETLARAEVLKRSVEIFESEYLKIKEDAETHITNGGSDIVSGIDNFAVPMAEAASMLADRTMTIAKGRITQVNIHSVVATVTREAHKYADVSGVSKKEAVVGIVMLLIAEFGVPGLAVVFDIVVVCAIVEEVIRHNHHTVSKIVKGGRRCIIV